MQRYPSPPPRRSRPVRPGFQLMKTTGTCTTARDELVSPEPLVEVRKPLSLVG